MTFKKTIVSQKMNRNGKNGSGGGQVIFENLKQRQVYRSCFLSLMQHFIVFVLSCFVGFQVIWNVSHSLHTPLMAVTNAISGIIILGALLQINSNNLIITVLASISVLIATINIVGGFMVTRRMLQMFQKS